MGYAFPMLVVTVSLMSWWAQWRWVGGLGRTAVALGQGRCAPKLVTERASGERLYVCYEALIEPLARRCPPEADIYPGDRVLIVEGEQGCRLRPRPLPAAERLAMGVKLDVNVEGAEGLAAISGIGPATARRLVAGRPYRGLKALLKVKGVGPRRLAAWRPHLTVRPRPVWATTASSSPPGPSGR